MLRNRAQFPWSSLPIKGFPGLGPFLPPPCPMTLKKSQWLVMSLSPSKDKLRAIRANKLPAGVHWPEALLCSPLLSWFSGPQSFKPKQLE